MLDSAVSLFLSMLRDTRDLILALDKQVPGKEILRAPSERKVSLRFDSDCQKLKHAVRALHKVEALTPAEHPIS